MINPAAGGDTGALVRTLERLDTIALRSIETAAAGTEARVVEQVLARWPEVVVAIGGDGTAGQVAAALRALDELTGQAPALLIAPGGTGNSSFRGLWGHRPWDEVATMALRPDFQWRTIDLARLEEFGAPVLLGCAAGLLPAALQAAAELDGGGRDLLLRATVAAAATFRPFPGRVIIDGEVLVEDQLIVADVGGMRHRGGDFRLLPHSVLDDGLLDVCVATAGVDLTELFRVAFTGAIDELPGVRYGRGRRIRLERTDGEQMLIEHDGELMPRTSAGYTLHVLPRALRVLMTASTVPGAECVGTAK
ncbi:diacylglycerol/lipid kinase family protein [Nocardia sp. NPDC051570]|uniref:diacylglycerol/lipid kinase family protein n=1 Tax=Nocardia sp. NPDC051570 TaxID=3364324 RepID=UPI0037B99B2B